MVCSHITVICLCFSNSQDVYTHDNYYDCMTNCYALSVYSDNMVCSHIAVICLCFSSSQDVYTHDDYYDCYASSNSHGVLTHSCYLFMFQ